MTQSTVVVRAALPGDLAHLCAFNAAMARETEGLELDAATLERGVAQGLADPARARYFMAECEDRLAGCLMLTLEWSDWRAGFWWWIQSVYVAPGFRRRGVYRSLHTHVAVLASSVADVVGLRLYVDNVNTGAQRTYEALGMYESRYQLFEQHTRATPIVP